MKKQLAAALAAGALTFSLVACGGGADTQSQGDTSAEPAKETTEQPAEQETEKTEEEAPAETIEVPAEYIDSDGGVTFAAVCGLTGHEFTTLLKQQGYEWNKKYCRWENPTTGDEVRVYSLDYKDGKEEVPEDFYEAATGKGDLANGKVNLFCNVGYEELQAGLDAFAKGLTVEDAKSLGFGSEVWSIVTDEAGTRHLLEISFIDENRTQGFLETDEFLAGTGSGSIDEMYN